MSKRALPPEARSSWPRPGQLMLAAGTAMALIATPIALDLDAATLTWHAAYGKNDGGGGGGNGGGNGGGGNSGGGHGGGSQGHGNGDGNSNSGGSHGNGSGGSQSQAHGHSDDAGKARAVGRDRQDDRIEHAKQRYDDAHDKTQKGERGPEDGDGQVAHRFSADETQDLIVHGWRARQATGGGFKNHGERVRTMVALAKRLGYDARVGALQANFGTPFENGIARIEADLAAARADLAAAGPGDEVAARLAHLEAELEAAVAAAKPGNGANHDWARADLDVNHDGLVDQRDLAALDAASADQVTPAAATR